MSRILAILALLAAPHAVDAQDVRVRLFEGRNASSARLVSETAPLAVSVDGAWVGTAQPGETVHVERDGAQVDVALENVRQSGATVEVVAEEAARLSTGRYRRAYRGAFEFESAGRGLRIINQVPIEPYVASVVAAEYPFREIEGAKAQAVLARTYALRHQGSRRGYDVEDSQRSQVYKGEGVVTETSREAAESTYGQVLRYDGRYVEAVYSSSSGGYTANNEDVWFSTPVPYLRARPDPYDADAPDHSWTASASASRVHRALSRYGSVSGVRVTDRAASGHVRRVELLPSGRTITGPQLRAALNASLGWRTIRSTNLEVSRSGDRYTFRGRGFGHGVGMSQYGARGQARAGYGFDEILAFYFPGTSLSMADGTEQPLVAVGSGPAGPRRWPTPRREARADTAGVSPRVVVQPDRRPAWVIREALPNEGRVRSRPTPRREARAAAEQETQRGGW